MLFIFYLKSILPTSCYNSSTYSILKKKRQVKEENEKDRQKNEKREGTATKNCNQSNQN